MFDWKEIFNSVTHDKEFKSEFLDVNGDSNIYSCDVTHFYTSKDFWGIVIQVNDLDYGEHYVYACGEKSRMTFYKICDDESRAVEMLKEDIF